MPVITCAFSKTNVLRATHVRPMCDTRATHVRPMCDHVDHRSAQIVAIIFVSPSPRAIHCKHTSCTAMMFSYTNCVISERFDLRCVHFTNLVVCRNPQILFILTFFLFFLQGSNPQLKSTQLYTKKTRATLTRKRQTQQTLQLHHLTYCQRDHGTSQPAFAIRQNTNFANYPNQIPQTATKRIASISGNL